MVRKMTDDGKGYCHEPPYTDEEEMDLYRRFGDAKSLSVLRAPTPQPPQKSRKDAQTNPRRT